MKYIIIIGQNYRDCKAKLDSITGEINASYTLATKAKHLSGIDFSEVILTDNAELNPNFKEMNAMTKKALKLKPKKKAKPTPKPVTPIVEEQPEGDLQSEEAMKLAYESIHPEVVDEEFKNELDALIEKDVDVVEEVPVEVPLIDELPLEDEYNNEPEPEIFEPEPELEVIVNEPVVEEEPVAEVVDEPQPEVSEPEVVEEVPEVAPEEEEVIIKPVNRPRGWQARNEFTDDVGNIFHKGKYVGKVTDE